MDQLNPIDAAILAFNNDFGFFLHQGSSAIANLGLALGLY